MTKKDKINYEARAWFIAFTFLFIILVMLIPIMGYRLASEYQKGFETGQVNATASQFRVVNASQFEIKAETDALIYNCNSKYKVRFIYKDIKREYNMEEYCLMLEGFTSRRING